MMHIEPQPIQTAYINPNYITAICTTDDGDTTLVRTTDGKSYRTDYDIHELAQKTQKAISEGKALDLYA